MQTILAFDGLFTHSRFFSVLELQAHLGWKGVLEILSSNPPAQAASTTVDFPVLCPVVF